MLDGNRKVFVEQILHESRLITLYSSVRGKVMHEKKRKNLYDPRTTSHSL